MAIKTTTTIAMQSATGLSLDAVIILFYLKKLILHIYFFGFLGPGTVKIIWRQKE